MEWRIDFKEKVVFEVTVKYTPGMMDTKWEIKSMPEALSEKFKDEVWNNLSVNIDETDWVNSREKGE